MIARKFYVLAGASALIVAAATSASAQEGVAVKNLLGAIGIIPTDRPAIEYRERPPLMVPKRLDLPPPVAPGSVGGSFANWPDDPDVRAGRRAAAAASATPGRAEGLPVSIEEVRASRVPGAGAATYPAGPPTNPHKTSLTPDELQSMNPRNRTTVLAGTEPERERLTDPPTGYRKPAGNAPLKKIQEPLVHNPDSAVNFQRQQLRR